jgi:hypothetical protein
MSKCKPESRSRQQDQLDLNNIINFQTLNLILSNIIKIIKKFPLRNLYCKITNHFTQNPI